MMWFNLQNFSRDIFLKYVNVNRLFGASEDASSKNEDIFKILLVYNKHMSALKNVQLYYALGSI